MQSCAKSALITIRPPKSASPSPALRTTPSIAPEYDDRPATRVCTSDAKEAEAGSEYAGARLSAVRGVARALLVLLPRRGFAPGGACRAGCRVRLSGARADRPRRGVRISRF